MKSLRIEYTPTKCIGAKKCLEAAPGTFTFDDKKAILRNSTVMGEKRILDAVVSPAEQEAIVKAACLCPVNAIAVIDASNHQALVSAEVDAQNVRTIRAEYDDGTEFVLDPLGYFLIRVDHHRHLIEVGFCTAKNKMVLKVTGVKPLEIYQTIINKIGLDLRKDHCAYLGRELQKAYVAIQTGIPYVQDEELPL